VAASVTTHRGDAAGRVLEALRPQPHRGDVVAAGVVVLTVLVAVVDVRFAGTWGIGIRFVLTALAAAFVTTMAVLAPLEGETPRAYQSILYVASFVLGLLALLDLARVLGADHPIGAHGTRVWVGLLLAGGMSWFATRRNSATCTLLGAAAAVVTVVAFFDWVFKPETSSTDRWILLLAVLVLVASAVSLRDLRRRHAVALVDVAGLGVLWMASTLLATNVLEPLVRFQAAGGAPWGWELVLLVMGCGLVAYAAVDREPGPAYLGALVLLVFVVIAAPSSRSGVSLIGWPLVLLLVAATALVIGLRPSRPLPAEPGPIAPPAPVTPAPTRPAARAEALADRLDGAPAEPPTERVDRAPAERPGEAAAAVVPLRERRSVPAEAEPPTQQLPADDDPTRPLPPDDAGDLPTTPTQGSK
jgi:hypothetical protein